MRCPPGAKECSGQKDQDGGEGCGKEDFAYWFSDKVLHPKEEAAPQTPPKPHGITLAQLPAACKAVLNAPEAKRN
jgi:penicillin-insensitive murein endopeptidase